MKGDERVRELAKQRPSASYISQRVIERVFSSAGNTVTAKWSHLDADKVEILVILKQQNCKF